MSTSVSISENVCIPVLPVHNQSRLWLLHQLFVGYTVCVPFLSHRRYKDEANSNQGTAINSIH